MVKKCRRKRSLKSKEKQEESQLEIELDERERYQSPVRTPRIDQEQANVEESNDNDQIP